MTNKIDWTDPRALGLKCIFTTSLKGENHTGVLDFYSPESFNSFMSEGDMYHHCRLAQGDKTPYDGKGENPVPDGVVVEVWYNFALLALSKLVSKQIMNAEMVEWSYVDTYQVQEQPLNTNETKPVEVDDSENINSKWRVSKSGFSIVSGYGYDEKVITAYAGAAVPVDAERFQEWLDNAIDICNKHNAIAPQLTPQFIAELIECLGEFKGTIQAIESRMNTAIPKSMVGMEHTIDKHIQTLKEL